MKPSSPGAAPARQERRPIPRPAPRPAFQASEAAGATPDSGPGSFWCEETRNGVEGEPKPTAASVLVVDDNIKVRIDLRGALHAAGFVVTACDSRVAALKALKSRSFDLVILDVLLQDGTGLELLRLLRSETETSDVPVILLSSDSGLKERARVLGLAVEEVLPKPLNIAYLTRCARRLVRLPVPADAPSDGGRFSLEGMRSDAGRGSVDSVRPADPVRPPVDSVRSPVSSLKSPSDSARSPADSIRSAADSIRSAADSVRSSADSLRASVESVRSPADSSRAAADAVKSSRPAPREEVPRSFESPLAVGSAWRNQDDVPSGSLLYRALLQSGVAAIIGPVTVARACRRAGVETSSTSPAAISKAIPSLRDTLRLFLTVEETERHVQKLEAALLGRSTL